MIIRFAAPALALAALCPTPAEAAPQPPPRSCPGAEEAESFGLEMLRKASPTPDTYERDRAAGVAALAERQRAKERIFAAPAGPGPHGMISHLAEQSRTAPDARRRELFRRAAEDQFGRHSSGTVARREDWAKGLSANAAGFVRHVIAAAGCRSDLENTAWLKADLQANGWYRISSSGEAADSAAWLLVQHADRDRPFQAAVLKMLDELVETGETNRKNHGYLFDRVAAAQGRPQRFATQGRCTGPGTWEPHETESPENVDQRRAALGLPPLADYKAKIASACH
jgi:hypothetical protein